MKILIWALALLLAGFMVPCAVNVYQEATEIKSGEVYELNFYPAHMESRPITSVTSNGGTVTTFMPVSVPDCYEVKYRQGDDKGDAVVSETQFDSLSIGDTVDFSNR